MAGANVPSSRRQALGRQDVPKAAGGEEGQTGLSDVFPRGVPRPSATPGLTAPPPCHAPVVGTGSGQHPSLRTPDPSQGQHTPRDQRMMAQPPREGGTRIGFFEAENLVCP